MTHRELQQLFETPDLAWVAERLRARMEKGQALAGTLTLRSASSGQRSAMDGLLARKATQGTTLSVRVEALIEATRVDHASAIVLACFGHVPNLRAERDQRAADWRQMIAEARHSLGPDPTGNDWIHSLEAGLLKRLARGDLRAGRDLLTQAVVLWEGIPYPDLPLAELAARVTGDTHALDRGRPLSTLLLRGLKMRSGYAGTESAELRRKAWESVGVRVDSISAPALTFNLRAAPGTQLSPILSAYHRLVQPCYLTYQIMQAENSFSPLPDALRQVFVVENPVVVEVAGSQLGSRCAPLICTEGQPASAVHRLLSMLADAGARIRIRADFDWAGLGFVDQLLKRLPNATPWRMDPATYLSADGSVPLSGRHLKTTSSWCAELVPVMEKTGCAIYEEQILPLLFEDLTAAR